MGKRKNFINKLHHSSKRNYLNRMNNQKVIVINWSDLSTLKDALRGIDLIIHAAGPNSVSSVNFHSETLHFSKDGTANLLNAAWNNQINKQYKYCMGLLTKE